MAAKNPRVNVNDDNYDYDDVANGHPNGKGNVNLGHPERLPTSEPLPGWEGTHVQVDQCAEEAAIGPQIPTLWNRTLVQLACSGISTSSLRQKEADADTPDARSDVGTDGGSLPVQQFRSSV